MLGGNNIQSDRSQLVFQSVVLIIALVDLQKCDPDIGNALHIAVLDQIFFDLIRSVNRNCKRQSFHARFRILRVADQLALEVEQTAARVAAVDRRIGLKQGHGPVFSPDLPRLGADDTVGYRSAERSERVSDGNNVLPDHQILADAVRCGGQRFGFQRLDFQHCQIRSRIRSNRRRKIRIGAVVHRHRNSGRALHHMVAGEDIALIRATDEMEYASSPAEP